MNIEQIFDEIKAALIKVTSGEHTRSSIENETTKITAYKVGKIVRVDIKEKLNNYQEEGGKK